MAGAVEVGSGGATTVDGQDDCLGILGLGDYPRHRHAVDDHDPREGIHPSLRSRITPLGVNPPLLTTPTRAPATWRTPASPRNWLTASCSRPMPWVRPCDSCPPWVLS